MPLCARSNWPETSGPASKQTEPPGEYGPDSDLTGLKVGGQPGVERRHGKGLPTRPQ
jgi:hypothetical protein